MDTPATPVQETANPGNGQPNGQNQPATPPATPPAQPAGMVQIDPKEHAQLLRDQARLRSLQRRGTRQPAAAASPDDSDPNDENVRTQNENRTLKEQIFQRDVRDGVRELLDKPEYASLPESTRKLILKAPHTLSESKDQEGVIADIEEFLSEEAAAMKALPPRQATPPHQPQGHETPPKVGSGSPAALPTQGLEDVSGLTGRARSQAVFRNLQKKAKGIKE